MWKSGAGNGSSWSCFSVGVQQTGDAVFNDFVFGLFSFIDGGFYSLESVAKALNIFTSHLLANFKSLGDQLAQFLDKIVARFADTEFGSFSSLRQTSAIFVISPSSC